jgi:fatty-acyl-CoA synthase
MQDFALTLDRFLTHAGKWHPTAGVVTAAPDGTTQRIGYAELEARARAISAALLAQGIGIGDHVATLAWNSQAHVETWYAIMGIGAACHTLNPRLTAAQLADMLDQSQARIVVASADLIPLAQQVVALLDTPPKLLSIDGPAAVDGLDTLFEPGASAAWGGFDERTPSGLCFTSGTTGRPKGVTYTHRACFLHTLRSLQADVMAITATDRVLAAVPMFHANAWGLPFAVPAVGATLVLPGRATDGASLARLIAAEGVTIAVGVPTVWLGLVEHLDHVGGEVPSLKRVIVGGAPMPPALMERIEARLRPVADRCRRRGAARTARGRGAFAGTRCGGGRTLFRSGRTGDRCRWLVHDRRPRADRSRRRRLHHRPGQGPNQIGRRMDQPGRDRRRGRCAAAGVDGGGDRSQRHQMGRAAHTGGRTARR